MQYSFAKPGDPSRSDSLYAQFQALGTFAVSSFSQWDWEPYGIGSHTGLPRSRGSRGYGGLRMSFQGLLNRREPNCVCIIAGSDLHNGMLPPIMICPCPSPSCGLYSSSGWVHMLCQLSKPGFQSLRYHTIFAAPHFAAPGL